MKIDFRYWTIREIVHRAFIEVCFLQILSKPFLSSFWGNAEGKGGCEGPERDSVSEAI